jgi:hypothetical protein
MVVITDISSLKKGSARVKRLSLIVVFFWLAGCSGGSSSSILFRDDFRSSSGWSVADSKTGVVSYDRGTLQVLPRTQAAGPAIATTKRVGSELADVSVQVDIAWTKAGGEEAGVVCRAERDKRRYTFSIGPDGRFDIGKKNGTTSLILLFGEVPAIKRGNATNRIRAECSGDILSFYVNDDLVGRVRDSDLKTGSVGLRAARLGGADQATSAVEFDDFVVRKTDRIRGSSERKVPAVGKLIMQDDFSNPKTNWLGPNGKSEGDGFKAIYSEGQMSFAVTAARRGISVDSGGVFAPDGRELVGLNDVSIEADVVLKAGPSEAPVGFYCRRPEPTLQAYYQSFVQQSGQYVIVKWSVENGQSTAHSLVGGYSRSIKTTAGAVNRLRFDCLGHSLRLIANGLKLAEVKDSEYTTGRIGLVVESVPDLTNPLDVRLDNLSVRELVTLR